MIAREIYKRLDKDFIKPKLSDEWVMDFNKFISENFKKRQMGLVLDNSKEVRKVYTAVFPSDYVLNKLLSSKEKDILLFTHHPMTWDIRKAPKVFVDLNKRLLPELRERRISMYTLHVPLDNYGPYSTSVTLARAIGIIPESSFAPYYGSLCGVIGKTDVDTVKELRQRFESALGHKSSLYPYGDDKIRNGKVAIIAGGGNDVEMLEEIVEGDVNTFVTGITILNDHSRKAHDYARQNKINILGGTHYSTEKFACIAMLGYFKKLGLSADFILDKPVFEDL